MQHFQQRRQRRQRRPNTGSAPSQLAQKVERLERKVSKTDAHQLWIKNNNMKQTVVKLTDVKLLQYQTVATASTFTNPIQLDPNFLSTYSGGAFVGSVPQTAIWDEYAKMYEYWMVEKIELVFHPVTLDVETTTTGIQDTCTWPTVGAKDADTQQVFWSPATSIATAQSQMSALSAKKGFRVTAPRTPHRLQSTVGNTLLLKQDAPMLKTNGSVSAREEYSTEVGSLVIIPARNPADRSLMGTIEFSIWYRFAGVHQPGIAIPRPLDSGEDPEVVKQLRLQVSQLSTFIAQMSSVPQSPAPVTSGD